MRKQQWTFGSNSVGRVLLPAACVLISCAAVALARQAATPSPSSQPSGSARLTVRVVAADNGAAVNRAHVHIFGVAPLSSSQPTAASVSKDAETDRTGRCTFSALPATSWGVIVTPEGGFVHPPDALHVKSEDGRSTELVVRVERTGAIVGRIRDDYGAPVVRAVVRALRRSPTAPGRRPSVAGSAAITNDRGEFRLFDLQPGTYYVAAEPQFWIPPRTNAKTGLAATYFPGAAGLEKARTVRVVSGRDTRPVDFALLREPLGGLSGKATDSTGEPLFSGRNGMGSVAITRKGVLYGTSYGGSVQKDGSFSIKDLPFGDYYLCATLQRGQGPDAYREGAFVPVTVNSDDVSIDIQTNSGATLSGRLVFEGAPTVPVSNPVYLEGGVKARAAIAVRAALQGNQAPGVSFPRGPVAVREDETFEVSGVRGPARVFPMVPGAAIKAILKGGQDITGASLDLTGAERISDMTIVLTYETGSLEGRVVDGKGRIPATRTYVVVFPDDASRWFELSPFVHHFRPMPPEAAKGGTSLAPVTDIRRWTPVAGGFFLTDLLPGRYLVAAYENPTGATAVFDRKGLEGLKARAVSIVVRAGEKTRVEVPSPPLPPVPRRPD